MELFNLGIENFNNSRFDSSSTAGTINRMSSVSNQSFADILNRVQSSENRSNTPAVVQDEKLYQLCLELETFLVKNLLTSMRNTVQKSGLIDEGFAGKIYEDMLYDEYANTFTRTAGFGLAEQAYRQLTGR
jgi:flagellar protein FlgJ